MALITPEELIVFLDLPADTEPTDRAQLVCTLVIDAVADAAGLTALVEPFPTGVKGVALGAAARLYDNPSGLWSSTIDDVGSVFPGERSGGGGGVLTKNERDALRRIYGTSPTAPAYTFPDWDWTWAATTSTTLTD